jgi:hypothetical protein
VVATDQALLMNQARTNGIAGLIDLPGVPAINLVLGLYNYKPSQKVVDQVTAQQTKSIQAQGAQGQQLLDDIDTYLAGINTRMAAAQPTAPPFTRTDIYALNAIKAQFLGQGGGNEVANALFLDSLRAKLGNKDGDAAFEDLRGRNDPEATYTTSSAKALPKVSGYRGSNVEAIVALRPDDAHRYDGCPMLSALPDALTVSARTMGERLLARMRRARLPRRATAVYPHNAAPRSSS